MDPRALHKALARARIAAAAIRRMNEAKSPEEVADDWVVFLLAWKAIYTALEKGSKSSPQSRQWFAAIKAQRKADPMLDYLFHARNDDEHGLDQSAEFQTLMQWRAEGGETYIVTFSEEGGGETVKVTDGAGNPQPLVPAGPPFLALKPVKLREATKVIHPPEEWEGMLILETSVTKIAPLALRRSMQILAEANRLRKP